MSENEEQYEVLTAPVKTGSSAAALQAAVEQPKEIVVITGPTSVEHGVGHVTMTLEEFQALGRERFGDNGLDWQIECPSCHRINTMREYPTDAGNPGQECIGRYVEDLGCKYAAYGFIPLAPWTIITPEGKHIAHFALAGGPPAPKDEAMQEQPDKRTPEQWCREYDLQIADPDGWRHGNALPWTEPITLVNFYHRALASTVNYINAPGWKRLADDARAAAPPAREEVLGEVVNDLLADLGQRARDAKAQS